MEQQNKSPELSELRRLADLGDYEQFKACEQFGGNLIAHRAAIQANQGRYPVHKPLSAEQQILRKRSMQRAAAARLAWQTRQAV